MLVLLFCVQTNFHALALLEYMSIVKLESSGHKNPRYIIHKNMQPTVFSNIRIIIFNQ